MNRALALQPEVDQLGTEGLLLGLTILVNVAEQLAVAPDCRLEPRHPPGCHDCYLVASEWLEHCRRLLELHHVAVVWLAGPFARSPNRSCSDLTHQTAFAYLHSVL